MTENPVQIKFWGVRGSIPTPGPRTLRYGGNTACIEVRFPGQPLVILDAGSGIRELGKELMQQATPVEAYIFISHFHWDHIQGLPFFKPAFKAGNSFTIFGCDEPHLPLNEIISMQMKPTFFPLAIEDMKAKVRFRAIREETLQLGELVVSTKFLNHPGYALGYRFYFRGKSFVYISDNEPYSGFAPQTHNASPKTIEEAFETLVEDKDAALVEFIRGADLLIHDTQFFPEEYREKITWGHSPYNYTVDLAIRGEVRQLVLFHHDPDHSDETIDRILALSREYLKQNHYTIPCFAAQEGTTITL